MTKASRFWSRGPSLEIPEGGSPFNEALLDTAKRELQEETGLRASQWEHLLNLHTSNSVTDESGVLYLAQGLEQGAAALDVTEDIEVLRVPLPQAIAWIFSGDVTDSLTVMGLLAAHHRLNISI